ncbi:MAG TPA: class I SAM-dependent methyltransferase [Candidatus Binatia bacterium]
MALSADEPKTAAAVDAWLERRIAGSDRFRRVAAEYDGHRRAHGCIDVYPFANGPLLGALAARAGKMIEVGSGLGYSGLWLAHGAGPDGRLETVERDRSHAGIARGHFEAEGLGRRVQILEGTGAAVLPGLAGGYDLAYFDTDPAESLTDLVQFERLLRPGGLLISTNLFLGQFAPDLPGLEQAAEYRERILDAGRWLTAYLADGTALSIRQ